MTSLKWSLCRLCLRSDCTLLDAYLDKEIQAFPLPEVIRELLQLVLSEDGGLPTTVCTCCISKLRDFQVFKNRVLKCDKLLRVIVRGAVQVLGANVDLNRGVEEENVELADSLDVKTNNHQWHHNEDAVDLDDVDIKPSSSSLIPQVKEENVELNDSVDVNTNNHQWTHNEDSVDLSNMDIKPSSSSLLPQVAQNLSDDGHHSNASSDLEEDTDFTLYLESNSEDDVESIGVQGGNVNSSEGDGYPLFGEESGGNSALISMRQDILEKSPLEKGQCGGHLEGDLNIVDQPVTPSEECSPHALPIDDSYRTSTSTCVRRSVRLQCSRYRSKISGRDYKNSQGMQRGCMEGANDGLLMPGVTASEDVEPSTQGDTKRILRSGSSFTDDQLEKKMENQQNCKGPIGEIKKRACKMSLNNEMECIRDERRKEFQKKKRDYMHRYRSSSSVEKKEALLQRQRIYSRRYYKSLSIEKKEALLQKQRIYNRRYYKSLIAEKKVELLQKQTELRRSQIP